jgi:acetyl esterase/lipase
VSEPAPFERIPYGPDAAQFGELSRPADSSAGTVVLVHGGFWRARYDLVLGRSLAADLAANGFTAWNIEYRRVGDGGWPQTFDDVAAAVDRLAGLDVDVDRVAAVGHSAGGQLAVWAAGRSTARVRLRGVVSQAGVLDLGTAARAGVGGTAVTDLLGGGPDDVPERFAAADPIRSAPLPVPVLCVHTRADDSVPFEQSVAYVAAAGGAAALWEVPGDHMALVDPNSHAWALVRAALPDLLSGRLPPSRPDTRGG